MGRASGSLRLVNGTIEGRRCVFRRTGRPAEVLELEDFTCGPPGAGEVRVRVLAAPVNPADLNVLEGTYGVRPELPAVPGTEGCGEVVDVGAGVEGLAAGQRVIFTGRAGTWSSHVTVVAERAFRLPAGIDPIQAAMLKVNPATAWRLLRGIVALGEGDWVVQNAGNSAVGRCVVQLARDLGVRTISFVRRESLAEELRGLGADFVFVDDDAGRAAAVEVMAGKNAALACNAVGGDSALRLMNLLREGGSHVTYGAMAKRPLTVPNGLLIFRDLRILGLWVSRWLERAPQEEIAMTYEALAARVAHGGLVQAVDSVHALEDFGEALARLEAEDRSGKVLLRPTAGDFL